MRITPNTRGLAAVYGSTFLSGGWFMIIPTIPVIALEFGISAGAAAQVVTGFAIGKFIGTVIAGAVLDRLGTRIALIGGPLLASLASIAAAGVPGFGAILVLTGVMGAADSLWSTGREIAGIDLAHQSQRGRVMSSLHGTYNLGAAVCPFIGGMLTDLFSYKASFIGYAVAATLSVGLGLFGPDSQAGKAQSRPRTPIDSGLGSLRWKVRGIVELFRELRPDMRPTYVTLVFATLTNQSQRIIVQSMLPLYAGYYLDLSPTQIGTLFTVSGVIVFAMTIPAGFIMDRVGRKWCTVPSTGLPALVFVLIPLTSSFTQLSVLVGIAGLAQGLSLGSLATSTYDVVPAHVRGRLQAVRRTIAESGSSLAPLLGGYLANTYNPGVPFLVYAPLLVLAAALLALVSKETLER